MQRLPVESSDIISVGYDTKTRVLEIEFHGGRVYQYRDVEPETYQHFMRAESHGLFFNASINGRYRYARIDESARQGEKPTTVAFITGNTRKYRDLQQACEPFDIAVEQLELPIDEIQSSDPEDIALKKAKQAYKQAGKRPVVVQDAFWNIMALRGFPGAYMSEVSQWLRADEFLKLMEGKADRTVYIKDTLVYYDGKRSKLFSQNYPGKIAETARGNGHFSVEQVVVMEGETQTIAEIEDSQGRSGVSGEGSIWNEFAKWYNLQRRLGKV
jgi:non-canonical purine NTP pyrophosphatase (RdgB/HAM1 family)